MWDGEWRVKNIATENVMVDSSACSRERKWDEYSFWILILAFIACNRCVNRIITLLMSVYSQSSKCTTSKWLHFNGCSTKSSKQLMSFKPTFTELTAHSLALGTHKICYFFSVRDDISKQICFDWDKSTSIDCKRYVRTENPWKRKKLKKWKKRNHFMVTVNFRPLWAFVIV